MVECCFVLPFGAHALCVEYRVHRKSRLYRESELQERIRVGCCGQFLSFSLVSRSAGEMVLRLLMIYGYRMILACCLSIRCCPAIAKGVQAGRVFQDGCRKCLFNCEESHFRPFELEVFTCPRREWTMREW